MSKPMTARAVAHIPAGAYMVVASATAMHLRTLHEIDEHRTLWDTGGRLPLEQWAEAHPRLILIGWAMDAATAKGWLAFPPDAPEGGAGDSGAAESEFHLFGPADLSLTRVKGDALGDAVALRFGTLPPVFLTPDGIRALVGMATGTPYVSGELYFDGTTEHAWTGDEQTEDAPEATRAEEPVEHRLRRAFLNGFREGVERSSMTLESFGRWDA